MPASCFVTGCKSKSSTPGISMHRFPSDPVARQSWLNAIHKEQGIARYSDIDIKDEPIDPEDAALSSPAQPDQDDERVRAGVVCSLHFPPNSFYYGNRRHLKPNSVPEADVATYWSNAAQVRKKVKRFRRMGPVGAKMAKSKMFCRKVTVRLPKLKGLNGRTTVRVCSAGETVDDSDSDAWVEPPEETLPASTLSVVPVAAVQTRSASQAARVKYATPAAAKAYQRRFAQSWSNKQQFAHDHGLYATPTLAEVKGRFLRLIESHESLLTRSRDHQTSAQQARNRLAVKKRQLNAKKKEIKELKEKLNALSKGKNITVVTKARPAAQAPSHEEAEAKLRSRTAEQAKWLRPQLVSRCTQTRASDFRARNVLDFDKSTMDSEFSVSASQEGRMASAVTPPSKKRPAGWTRWKKVKKPAADVEEPAIQDEVPGILEETEHRLGVLGPVEDHDDDAINAVLEQTVSDARNLVMADGLSKEVSMEQQPQHPVVLTLEESILAEMMSAGDDVDVPAQLDLSVLQQI